MLGRTDSRGRLLFLLVVFVIGSTLLTARLAYWQVVDRERLAGQAAAQTTVTLESPSKRGDIYDRTGTVVLATTVQRERLVAAPDQLTPGAAPDDGRWSCPDPRARRGRRGRAARPDDRHGASTSSSRHGLERDHRRPDPRGDRRQARLRPVARARARAGLPAGRRRTGLDPRGPPPRLRQPRGRRPVRRRAALPGDARRRAAGRRRRSATPAARRCSTTASSARPGRPARTCG